MPFTFAHPAIVLPLARLPKKYISLTGLVAGSIAPDFEYFIRMKPVSHYSHTLPGIILFNIPAAIIISFTFHYFVKNQLIDHLPLRLYSRFHHYKSSNWTSYFKKYFLPFLFSVAIGSFSHILWDSFTHETGFFVRLFPFLNAKVSHFPLFRLIQHGSTIAGFAFIGLVILNMEKTFSIRPVNSIKAYWTTVALVAFLFVAGYFWIFFTLFKYLPYFGVLVVSVINGSMLGLLLASFFSRRSFFKEKKTSITAEE